MLKEPYTDTHGQKVYPEQQTGGLEWYSSQSASSVLCLGFDTNPHSMGAHSTTWGVCVFMRVSVYVRVRMSNPPPVCQHRKPNSIPLPEGALGRACTSVFTCVCVCSRARVLHASVYLWCVIRSVFHMKLVLINQFMEGQLYEPRLSSALSQWNLAGFLSSSGSHNPPSGQSRSYTVTRKTTMRITGLSQTHAMIIQFFSSTPAGAYAIYTFKLLFLLKC